MRNVEFCRDLADRCRAAADRYRYGGHATSAASLDGAALGFAFRAAELEYDARGGMTARQALGRAALLGLLADRPRQ
jgi:hypothetical protein